MHHEKLLTLFLTKQEGCGPSQIVSSQLEVGGRIKRNASNGNTNVCINNREITRKELRILKVVIYPAFIFSLALLNYKDVQITQMGSCSLQMAGVPCEGRPSFWVSADGSYQEEGMNNGGKIWDKVNFMR